VDYAKAQPPQQHYTDHKIPTFIQNLPDCLLCELQEEPMSSALKGVLILVGISHLMLVIIPVLNTLYASISAKSKLLWCAFLIFLPFVGVAIFHFRYRSSLFQEESDETRRNLIKMEKQKYSQYGNDDKNH